MKSLVRYLFAAGALSALIVSSCDSRSLVAIEVTGDTRFDDVTLRITANDQETKEFPHATFDPATIYRIGVYLPADMTGTIRLEASAESGLCVIGRGTAQALNVKAGELSMTVPLQIRRTPVCEPIPDGGAGGMDGGSTSGAGGGSGGSSATGAGGSGAGGSNPGTGGSNPGAGGSSATGAGGTFSTGAGGSSATGAGGTFSTGAGGTGGRGGGGGTGGTGGVPGTGGVGSGTAGAGGRGGTGAGGTGAGSGGVATGGGGGGGTSTCVAISPCTTGTCGYHINNCGATVDCGVSCPVCQACDLSTGYCTGGGTTTSAFEGDELFLAPPTGTGGIICTTGATTAN